jgi:acetophenone carboxylase
MVAVGNSWIVPEDIGLYGGYATSVSPAIFIPDANIKEEFRCEGRDLPADFHDLLQSKSRKVNLYIQGTGHMIPEGGIAAIMGVSGGGYGDVLERDPDSVMRDLKADVISPWTAKNVYHVAYDEKKLTVDYEKTRQLRAQERKDRIKRGIPLKEFEKEWLKKKPPEAALKNYGKWPHAF